MILPDQPTGGRIARAELRSLRWHQEIAKRVARDPHIIQQARERLLLLRSTNSAGRVYHDQWEALLAGPLSQLLKTMTEASQHAADLRRESPFTALLTPRERGQRWSR